jgi:predicted RNase H-like HicB family nuclease/Arc/MetJ family transcription regulator
MHRYIALIHKEKKSHYGVMFPDFPGCVAAADTMDDALVQGREALAFHVEGMRFDGEAIPAPRTLDEIKAAGEDWVVWKDSIVATIPLVPPKGEAVRVNINIDENLLAAADAAAKRAHQSRSAFVARALETALEGDCRSGL